jgi:(2Fe-2S) ferredoxin
MNFPKYRVFVCIKQCANAAGGCCGSVGALDIYQKFQSEIADRQLGKRVEVEQSGCLNRWEAGAVALVYRTTWREFAWLPRKLRMKLQRILFPDRTFYGHLTCEDIPAIVESHLISGRSLQRCEIATDR